MTVDDCLSSTPTTFLKRAHNECLVTFSLKSSHHPKDFYENDLEF